MVGEPDARDDVPVLARPARDLQRAAGGDDVQPPLRVQDVGEAEQVVLVGAAAVVQDEQALGRAVRRALLVDRARSCQDPRVLDRPQRRPRAPRAGARAAWAGVSASPRCSASSSTAKPGRERGDLEQDPARDAEVDRLEVVAVAHVGHVAAGVADARLPGQVVLVARGPGDVMDAAGALLVVPRGRRVVGEAELALGAAEQVLAPPSEVKPSSVGQDCVLDAARRPRRRARRAGR